MQIVLLIMLNLWLSTQPINQHFVPEIKTTLDASTGPSLLKQCSRSTPEKVSGFYNPAPNTISKMERVFTKITTVEATSCCIIGGRILDLKRYGYQYVGIEIEGRKFIYINAFHLGEKDEMEAFHKDWKTKPVKVCDGGESYWGIMYDVQKGRFSQLSINGVG